MKRRDLEKKLKEKGFYPLRNGGDHDIFTDGTTMIPVPRHKEINENLAKGILRKAGCV